MYISLLNLPEVTIWPNSIPVNRKNAGSWFQCFVFGVSAGRAVFLEYLRSEYSEENILFWLACEELKQEGNQNEVEEKARSIYEEYISMLSPKEVPTQHTIFTRNYFYSSAKYINR